MVALFGRGNWWLPSWLARALRVAPSPAQAAAKATGPAPAAGPAGAERVPELSSAR